ncbi:MAG: heme lyase CcmF/NrfE family subunit [Alphaproteobacteria bacterium]|nr:MAG: heme lyase CcmF/NrfE family subunit [Alphaproteobacteria bacterium]
MIAEFGHFCLALGILVALYQSTIPLIAAQKNNLDLMRTAVPAAQMQLLLVAASFFALMYAFVVSDFSLLVVWENSHTDKPLLYKISGVWGNHEGSMLLWVFILSIFGAAIATFGRNLPSDLRARVLAVQGMLGLAFLLFIEFTSNPFLRVRFPAPNGNGLNPLLQDPGLAFHPPFLYLGYVGFSVAFSFAIAALIGGRVDAAWARWVRPWTLAAWVALTIGIALGSYWAYYELGWGGWWFWDPVENASFMPWLVGTALLHSAIVVERRGTLKAWTILLAILAFSLSLLGTFLVRSGVLTSVHAFAVDPARGVFILSILLVAIGGSFALFAWRGPVLKGGGLFAPISREGGLLLNNLFLTVAAGVVLIGTIYPLLGEAFGFKVSVGAPFFNMTFGPLMVPLLLLVPVGPLLAWKRGDLIAAMQRLYAAAGAALLALILTAALTTDGPILSLFGMALAAWLIVGALSEWTDRIRLFRVPVGTSLARARGLPRSAWGMTLAHFGLGLTIMGIVGVSAWRTEDISVVQMGESRDVAGFSITLDSVRNIQGPNYDGHRGVFLVSKGGKDLGTLSSERRVYRVSSMPTTEVGLRATLRGDLYVVLGDPQGEPKGSAWVVRSYYNPLVGWIWLGALVMGFGGLVSLSDRRFRMGVPVKAGGKKSGVNAKGAAAVLFLALSLSISFGDVPAANAVEPDEVLSNPALEARARKISKQLRCLVCQNENIDSSHAELARDLRLLVRERLMAGDSDDQVLQYIVARYGDFVLLKPPVQADTLPLWGAPVVLLLFGGLAVLLVFRRQTKEPALQNPLSAEDENRLKELLDD